MPRFNTLGNYEAGIGGGDEVHGYVALIVDGLVRDPGPGGGGDWLTDQEVACYRYSPMPFRAVAINAATGANRTLRTSTLGFNAVTAGGGRWATTETQTGRILMDDGTEVPYPLLALGQHDGCIAMRAHPYNGSGLIVNGTILVQAATDEDVVRHGTNCWDVQVLDQGHVVWRGRDGAHAVGLPVPQLLPGGSYGLRVAKVGNVWWVLYLAAEFNGSLVCHPVDSFMGCQLTSPGALAYRPDLVAVGSRLLAVYAVNESEQTNVVVEPGVTYPIIDLTTTKPTPPEPEPTPPDPDVNPPVITITSYAPTSGPVPLRVTAVYAAEPDSGPITELHWQARVLGDAAWGDAAVNSPDDFDHTYVFSDPASYELRLLARGPGGDGVTTAQRLVTAMPPAPEPEPPQPEPPTPGGEMVYIDLRKNNLAAEKCEQIDNGNGTFSYRKVSNGKVFCVTNTGDIEERDDPGGPWESFYRTSNALVADREWEGEQTAFLLPYAEVK